MSKTTEKSQEVRKALENAILIDEGIPSLNPVKMDSLPIELKNSQAQELIDIVRTIGDQKFKPEPEVPEQVATKLAIATLFTKFVLIERKQPRVSTYNPVPINYFRVLHFMDNLIASNIYFQDQCQP